MRDATSEQPYFVGSSVEARDLGGALQEAAAALAQMLAHPTVERRDAAGQPRPGVGEGVWRGREELVEQLDSTFRPKTLGDETFGDPPSTTAKFWNPMASSLRLTTSDNSDTFQKHEAVSGGSCGVDTSVQVEYFLLELLDICCHVNQLFGGQRDGPPPLAAAFLHRRPAGGGGGRAG